MAITTSNGNGFALYNGWKLPKLPTDLDSSEYQYMYLDTPISGQHYYLYFMKKPMLWDDQYDSPAIQEGAGRLMYPISKGGDTWGERSATYQNSTMMIGTPVLWTNHNVYKSDGSAALDASDPIPLDGMNVIEWDGDTSGLPTLAALGEPALYIADGTFFDLSEDVPYYLRFTTDFENSVAHTVYGNIGQSVDLDYTRQPIADGVYWSRYIDGAWTCLLSGDVPAYGLTGTAFFSANDADLGHWYTSLFAYRPAPTYDRTVFLSGLTMGLCSKGNPTFEGSDDFVWGELQESVSGSAVAPQWLHWANTDILNVDGSVYLAASDPVPVEDTFTKGYHAGAALRRKRVLPVAYLYNDIPLPKQPVWDKEAEPYAVIFQNSAKNYCFWTGSSPVKVSNSGKVNGMFLEYRVAERWQWREKSKPLISTDAPLWANYDVYNSDGATLLLAASDPTPLFAYPVFDDWLYNGEVFPALPEWDKATYPYAFISGGSLVVTKTLPHYHNDEYPRMSWDIADGVHAIRYSANGMRTEWNAPYSMNGAVNYQEGVVTWANFDVYGDDGTLYLAASEPVPINE